ncbi:MAG: bifunctional (p)ppGpp synthetase/guanosine-3',5'-bis(diphosphate) 3'-pyrophosphohydrolase [Deltaproteobacteria bacterium]|nr:bifunctional (p)ppGpp synthetase/guanosine-3',5'-bis(diphosphate) 3'-pyrophosphohydrolase [Deltaproteobacteria bacterium]
MPTPIKQNEEKNQGNDIKSLDPNELFQKFLSKVKSYIKNEEALANIEKAYNYAHTKHGDQKRASGAPYIIHPIAVAEVLSELHVDVASLIAALLHDVVEDTGTGIEEIKAEFGETIADLVDGLTKLAKIEFRSSQERMAENFRKMILAMARDLRVIIIKLADRLHNMRTLESLPSLKRRRIAQETLDIYAPLAGRLGIYHMRSELEDLCLKETKNEVYKEIARNIAAKKKERETYIKEVKEILENELRKYGFKNAKVYGRPKHFFSIYKKMLDRQLAFKDIHDLFAFRILVDNVRDCYEVVGIVHAMWKPMPGRFKDYIAMPKPNFYQSLHTTVIRPNGSPAEIQIRTHDMHKVCEYGIAAHWAYKEKATPGNGSTDLEKFAWLRQIMELQHDVKDPNEFLAAIKVDLFDEEIFVFTPQGDVHPLPLRATPLDFAFAVHTDVGLSSVGAKVNGRITPLRGKLQSGDIVEILTSPNQHPSKDWLNFVVTTKARNKIRSFLRAEERTKSKEIGKEILEDELEKKHLNLNKLISNRQVEQLYKAAKEGTLDDLFVVIGYGKINVPELIEKVFPEHTLPQTKEIKAPSHVPKSTGSGVLVSGLDNILVTFGRCCNPLPGEDIFGFITRGRGVSVHRTDCPRALDLDPVRRVKVSWTDTTRRVALHRVHLRIITLDRQGVLAEITMAISKCGANIQKAQVKVSNDGKGILLFEITVKDLEHLTSVMKAIASVPDTILVDRQS